MTTSSSTGHIRVRLLKAHTHAGHHHQIGDEIDVVASIAEWLHAQGTGHAVQSKPPALSAASKPPALGTANTDSTKTA